VIDVQSTMKIEEVEGVEDNKVGDRKFMFVESHRTIGGFVILKSVDPKFRVTVRTRDLKAALENSENVNRHG